MSDQLPGDNQITPPDERTPIDPSPGASPLLEELKHSIRIHLMVMGGATSQLAVFLVKLIDLIEDADPVRKNEETAKLAFALVEATALHVQQSVDARAAQAITRRQPFPTSLQAKSDNLLIIIGKSRGLPDKIVAKNAVLKEVAETLRALSNYTKARYPDMTDVSGNIL